MRDETEIRTDTPAEIPERTGNIEWHEYSRAAVGMDGPHLVVSIERVDEAPVEAYSINSLSGLYVSISGAKREAERGYRKSIEAMAMNEIRGKMDLNNGLNLQDMRDLLSSILAFIDAKLQQKKDAAAGPSSDPPPPSPEAQSAGE
jgi:hypothetical protein